MLWKSRKGEQGIGGEDRSDRNVSPSAIPSSESTQQRSAGAGTPQTASMDLLPRILFQQGKVSREAIKRAMLRQRETGEFIGDILIREGLIDENSLLSFVSKNCRIPHVSILNYIIDDELLKLVPRDICMKHRVLPLDRIGRNLTVAMVNPLDGAAYEALKQCCPDLRIKPILCSSAQFESVSGRLFAEGKKKGGMPTYIRRLSAESSADKASPDAKPMDQSESITVSKASTADTAELPPLAPDAQAALEKAGDAVSGNPPAEILSTLFTPHEGEDEEIGEDLKELAQEAETDDLDSTAQRLTHVLVDSMRNAYGVLARKLDLLRGVPPQEITMIFAMGKVHEFLPGEVVFEKGSVGESVFAILSGKVEVLDGERRIALLDQGETVGEMALAEQQTRSATVRAVEQTALLEFTLEDIRNRFKPEVSIQLLLNIITTLSGRFHLKIHGG